MVLVFKDTAKLCKRLQRIFNNSFQIHLCTMEKEKETTQEGADEFRQTLLSLWERHCFKLRCYTFSSREPSENVSNKQLHYSRLHQKAAAQQK